MKRALRFLAALVVTVGAAHAAEGPRLVKDDLLMAVDSSGRRIGVVGDGLASDSIVYVLAETARRQVFLLGMMPTGFVAESTVHYDGAGCSGTPYANLIADPSLLFVEKAQVGVVPGTRSLAAFLVERESGYREVQAASYWYEGECVDSAQLLPGARALRAAKNLSAFVPPFSLALRGRPVRGDD